DNRGGAPRCPPYGEVANCATPPPDDREGTMRKIITAAAFALATVLVSTADAADKLKLAIGQRGIWHGAPADLGMRGGIFPKHGLELEILYTDGAGQTMQAVIAGSADIGVSVGTLGVLGAYAKGAPIRLIRSGAVRQDAHPV